MAYTSGDPVALAKAISTWVKDNAEFTFKLGIVDGKVITVEEIKQLATMPGKDELFSKLLFLINAPGAASGDGHRCYWPRSGCGGEPGRREEQVRWRQQPGSRGAEARLRRRAKALRRKLRQQRRHRQPTSIGDRGGCGARRDRRAAGRSGADREGEASEAESAWTRLRTEGLGRSPMGVSVLAEAQRVSNQQVAGCWSGHNGNPNAGAAGGLGVGRHVSNNISKPIEFGEWRQTWRICSSWKIRLSG